MRFIIERLIVQALSKVTLVKAEFVIMDFAKVDAIAVRQQCVAQGTHGT